MELYLLRHAHAGDPLKWDGEDAARPLSRRGRRQAERLGDVLSGAGFRPDAIVASTKLRTRETAALVAERLGMEPRFDDRLADRFDRRALAELVEEAGRPERLLLVGHDPDLSDLLAELVGVEWLPMRKGTLARVDLGGSLDPGAGTLRWFIPPDAIALGPDDA